MAAESGDFPRKGVVLKLLLFFFYDWINCQHYKLLYYIIILPKLCNVMDYVTDYIFCHVIWNQ